MKKVAFLFPGQGSQTPGMGSGLLEHPIAVDLFEQANQRLGFDLKELCLNGPADKLTLTQFAQPAILTVSTIAHRIFAEQFPEFPLLAAGHSLGEYSALVAAGVLDFADAVEVVYYRGLFMQEAVPVGVGSMAAILGMDAEGIEALCQEQAGDQFVAPANYNCKGQIVISGHTEAVKRVLEHAKGKLLDVSAPFHSKLMEPAALKLQEKLGSISFSSAKFGVVNNTENQVLLELSTFLPSLVAQVSSPVRWDTGVLKMIEQGAEAFIEFGEGKVLAGMGKRIDRSTPYFHFGSLDELEGLKGQLAAYL